VSVPATLVYIKPDGSRIEREVFFKIERWFWLQEEDEKTKKIITR